MAVTDFPWLLILYHHLKSKNKPKNKKIVNFLCHPVAYYRTHEL